MIDMLGVPSKYNANVQTFFCNTSVDSKGFDAWYKPRGASMVFMFCVGGGAGGGGGHTGTAGTTRIAGGGGACSGITTLLIPAILLPDTLYIQVGAGGKASTSQDTNGGAGLNSYILTAKTVAVPNIIIASNANAPGGGNSGNNNGTAGTVPTVFAASTFTTLGLFNSKVGLLGGTGASGAGASITAWAAMPLSAGAGGSGLITGAPTAGGAQTATALTELAPGVYFNTNIANGGPVTTGVAADPGYKSLTPFLNSGGAGGGGSDAGTGGNGGNGGYGCGGGGGGAGVTGQGGLGGNGGDGVVIIAAW